MSDQHDIHCKVSTGRHALALAVSILALSSTGAAFSRSSVRITRHVSPRRDEVTFGAIISEHNDQFQRCSELWATKGDESLARKRRVESPLGVRRRVRAVLERARNRTGIQNASGESTFTRSASSVVADAASIGGLGGVLVDDNGTVDVVLDLSEKGKKKLIPGYNDTGATIKDMASTPSPVVNTRNSEEDLVMAQSPNVPPKTNGIAAKAKAEVDAIRTDIPAAFSEPLPFTLPKLSRDQRLRLAQGERLQEQSKMGREGSGFVVLDVKAPPYVVWECLLDFESYTETIPTVRGVSLFTSENLKSGYHAEKPINPGTGRELRHYGTPSTTRAAFTLSKFRLNIAAIHNYRPHPNGDYMIFTLDPECTNLVLKAAKGIWHTETNPDGRGEEYTRVWLLCELKVSSMLPKFIVDYAARRAMPRATTWLKPEVEAAAQLWLKNMPNDRVK